MIYSDRLIASCKCPNCSIKWDLFSDKRTYWVSELGKEVKSELPPVREECCPECYSSAVEDNTKLFMEWADMKAETLLEIVQKYFGNIKITMGENRIECCRIMSDFIANRLDDFDERMLDIRYDIINDRNRLQEIYDVLFDGVVM